MYIILYTSGATYQHIIKGYLYNTIIQIKFVISNSEKTIENTKLKAKKLDSRVISEKAIKQAIIKRELRRQLRKRRRIIEDE